MKVSINYFNKRYSFLFLLLIFLTVSCSTTFNVGINPKLDNIPQTNKKPETIGIYYSPEFRNYVHLRTYSNDKIVAAIGGKSAAVINKIFSDSFNNVMEVKSIPNGSDKIDFYVEPVLVAYDFRAEFLEKRSQRHEIVINFTFYSNKGVPLKSFNIRGKDPKYKSRLGWHHVSHDMENFALNLAKELGTFSLPYTDAGRDKVEYLIKKEDIKITANVVKGLEKQVKEFDCDLESYYIIPVEIDLKNIGDSPIKFRNTDIRLVLANKRKISPAKGPQLLTQFERISHASDIVFLFSGPLLAGIAEVSEASEKRNLRTLKENVFLSKEIKNNTLNKNESDNGYVYFIPFDKDKTLNKEELKSARLEFWVIGKNPSDAVKLEVLLEDINWLTEKEAEIRIKKRAAEIRKKRNAEK